MSLAQATSQAFHAQLLPPYPVERRRRVITHVLVFQDVPHIAEILTAACEAEGYLVTQASTVEDTLMILRTSLHPMLVIAERDHSSLHPDGPFFVTIRDHPEFYAHHRYIAIHYWKLTEEEEALMNELGVPLLQGPFDLYHLFALVDAAAASLAQEPAKPLRPVRRHSQPSPPSPTAYTALNTTPG